MKLDVLVDESLALRCLEQFSPTSAGPQDPELRVCQVSGLLPLQPPSALRLRTIPGVRLKAERYLTFFGLFQGPRDLGPPWAGSIWGTPLRHRRKRGSEEISRHQEQRQPHRKRSVLHLTPSRCSTNDEGDTTAIWWQPFLQMGRALEVSGPDVTVKQTGLYFIYSQVLLRTPPGGVGLILLRCVQSMPQEQEQAYNSCYSAGIFQLQRGDQLSLRIPRANASLDLSPHGTFLGLLRL
ncbi:tumor necrosis factor ligand superfamily member 13-like isoform X2 [Carettochelys insculpta]|uniref:tumor necrosis factor ligand superfamily member 13-like isoform X2 n=1 Tax=Carettochelys insculpta TaxID=44489 RepID=UPI003EB73052